MNDKITHHEVLQGDIVRDGLIGHDVGLHGEVAASAAAVALAHDHLEEVRGDRHVVHPDHLVPVERKTKKDERCEKKQGPDKATT